jgi:hypothetical protein
MPDNEIEKLVELFNSPVKSIKYESNMTIVEFQNGQTVPLYGGTMPIQLQGTVCTFCGLPKDQVFTTNDKAYICKECLVLGIRTLLENGVNIDINISDLFPDAASQIKRFDQNITNMGEPNS